MSPAQQLSVFNDFMIKYFENVLALIANDTDRQLQLVVFSKEHELTLVVVILLLLTQH